MFPAAHTGAHEHTLPYRRISPLSGRATHRPNTLWRRRCTQGGGAATATAHPVIDRRQARAPLDARGTGHRCRPGRPLAGHRQRRHSHPPGMCARSPRWRAAWPTGCTPPYARRPLRRCGHRRSFKRARHRQTMAPSGVHGATCAQRPPSHQPQKRRNGPCAGAAAGAPQQRRRHARPRAPQPQPHRKLSGRRAGPAHQSRHTKRYSSRARRLVCSSVQRPIDWALNRAEDEAS